MVVVVRAETQGEMILLCFFRLHFHRGFFLYVPGALPRREISVRQSVPVMAHHFVQEFFVISASHRDNQVLRLVVSADVIENILPADFADDIPRAGNVAPQGVARPHHFFEDVLDMTHRRILVHVDFLDDDAFFALNLLSRENRMLQHVA